MRGIVSIASVLVAVLLSGTALAEKFWDTKDYLVWTEKECKELLTKSPWAFSNAFGQVSGIGATAPAWGEGETARPVGSPTFGERDRTAVFEFRWATAKPIRMALGRLELLKSQNNAALKEKVQQYVDAPPGNEVVLEVSFRTVPAGDSSAFDILSYFRHATLADFRDTTELITSGPNKTIPVAAYLPPGEKRSNPAFVFPRLDESGKPNFTGAEKSIVVRSSFRVQTKGRLEKYDVYNKLNPKQMRLRGEFAF